ncbi:TPA: phenol degradation protein meta [Pseudomonas aeruginosa]|uniref:SphA family protein n=1 Tax=Pseudomonas aeruginosa TaxID=287 RepID=UPI00069219EA|nr:transporter [Pseudomonas aeruginosa]MCO3323394.1 phenol degradation protein meta [Pseudomonas aeruginosa]HBO5845099.1 phenol degradation protein meta [Pseudomonas aeruginosa]HBO5909669.1 phenol degradation protein meta [Pseudomonas aeruginosa]
MNCAACYSRSAFICVYCSILFSATALATENGQQSYPIGSNTVLSGIIPDRGKTQFYNYSAYYHADKFAGNHGESAVPGFKADVLVDALRVVHTWDIPSGPFELASGIVVPFVHSKLSVPVGRDSRGGLGDIVLHGLYVGYKKPETGLFSFLALDFALPTGSFSENRIANNGLNTYGFMPNVNLTWFPLPRTELSATLGYEINSPNRETNYHSGNVAFLDWVAGYSVLPNLQIGLQGYALRQTTDDKLNGEIVGEGFRGQVFAIGPQVRYNFSREAGIILKWQSEFNVRNRPEGDKLWVQFSFPL